VDQAVAWLQDRLPRGWSVEEGSRSVDLATPAEDAKISLRGPQGTISTVAVEEKQSISPRGVVDLLPQVRTARKMGAHLPLLVVAPWVSRRTQELLAEQDLNYIDLTGNALLRFDNPPFYLEAEGSARNPAPKERGRAQLRGAKAARLIRLLADVRPPYRVGELAEATGLAPGYVSRLLDALYREALIERSPRGPVESVDLAGLLHRWASSYDVFEANAARGFIAPSGVDELLADLREGAATGAQLAITGSFAASRLAPVTAPAMLLAYCDSPAEVAARLGLLEAEEGANAILLQPFDPVAWERGSSEQALRFAAPSQVAVDCMTGNGRMPAEGEALLDWMLANEPEWRADSLPRATARS
jgi:hypothetical protein